MVSWLSVKLVRPSNFCHAINLQRRRNHTYILPFHIRASTSSSTYLVYSVASRWVGGSSGDITAADVGRRLQWAVATAAGIDAHEGDSSGRCYLGDSSSSGDCSRVSYTNTLHLPHITFLSICHTHTRAHVPMFQPTCRNSLTAQHGCYVSTMHVERTRVTGTSIEPSCPV